MVEHLFLRSQFRLHGVSRNDIRNLKLPDFYFLVTSKAAQ